MNSCHTSQNSIGSVNTPSCANSCRSTNHIKDGFRSALESSEQKIKTGTRSKLKSNNLIEQKNNEKFNSLIGKIKKANTSLHLKKNSHASANIS